MQETILPDRFIESVFVRPKMYTLTGSYVEVVAYLTGYYSGIAKEQKELKETHWVAFCRWLSDHLDTSTAKIFEIILEQYGDESLAVLIRLYAEFKLLDKANN